MLRSVSPGTSTPTNTHVAPRPASSLPPNPNVPSIPATANHTKLPVSVFSSAGLHDGYDTKLPSIIRVLGHFRLNISLEKDIPEHERGEIQKALYILAGGQACMNDLGRRIHVLNNNHDLFATVFAAFMGQSDEAAMEAAKLLMQQPWFDRHAFILYISSPNDGQNSLQRRKPFKDMSTAKGDDLDKTTRVQKGFEILDQVLQHDPNAQRQPFGFTDTTYKIPHKIEDLLFDGNGSDIRRLRAAMDGARTKTDRDIRIAFSRMERVEHRAVVLAKYVGESDVIALKAALKEVNEKDDLVRPLQTAIEMERPDLALLLTKEMKEIPAHEVKSLVSSAIFHSQYDTLKFLLKHVPENTDTNLFFMMAAFKGNVSIIELLVKFRPDTHLPAYARPALEGGHPNLALKFLEKPRRTISDFYSAAAIGIEKGNLSLISSMLGLIPPEDPRGVLCLLIEAAVCEDQDKILQLIFDKAPVLKSMFPLLYGALVNDKQLIERTVLNSQNDLTWESLQLAIRHDQPEIVALILEHEASVRLMEKSSSLFPLTIAAARNLPRVAKAILDFSETSGVDISKADFVMAPIRAALQNGHGDMVDMLLKFVRNTRLQGLRDQVDFDFAINMIELHRMIELGSVDKLQHSMGQLPPGLDLTFIFEWAIDTHPSSELCRMLVDHKLDYPLCLLLAIGQQDMGLCELLLAKVEGEIDLSTHLLLAKSGMKEIEQMISVKVENSADHRTKSHYDAWAAVKTGDLNMVSTVLKSSLIIDDYAFLIAAALVREDREIINYVMDRAADRHTTPVDGEFEKMVGIAIEKSSDRYGRQLVRRILALAPDHADCSFAMQMATEKNDFELVSTLLKDVHPLRKFALYDPLAFAAKNGYEEVAVLISQHAPENMDRSLAFFYARMNDNEQIAKMIFHKPLFDLDDGLMEEVSLVAKNKDLYFSKEECANLVSRIEQRTVQKNESERKKEQRIKKWDIQLAKIKNTDAKRLYTNMANSIESLLRLPEIYDSMGPGSVSMTGTKTQLVTATLSAAVGFVPVVGSFLGAPLSALVTQFANNLKLRRLYKVVEQLARCEGEVMPQYQRDTVQMIAHNVAFRLALHFSEKQSAPRLSALREIAGVADQTGKASKRYKERMGSALMDEKIDTSSMANVVDSLVIAALTESTQKTTLGLTKKKIKNATASLGCSSAAVPLPRDPVQLNHDLAEEQEKIYGITRTPAVPDMKAVSAFPDAPLLTANEILGRVKSRRPFAERRNEALSHIDGVVLEMP